MRFSPAPLVTSTSVEGLRVSLLCSDPEKDFTILGSNQNDSLPVSQRVRFKQVKLPQMASVKSDISHFF